MSHEFSRKQHVIVLIIMNTPKSERVLAEGNKEREKNCRQWLQVTIKCDCWRIVLIQWMSHCYFMRNTRLWGACKILYRSRFFLLVVCFFHCLSFSVSLLTHFVHIIINAVWSIEQWMHITSCDRIIYFFSSSFFFIRYTAILRLFTLYSSQWLVQHTSKTDSLWRFDLHFNLNVQPFHGRQHHEVNES